MIKFKFKSLEELQDKYPVGSIFFENYRDVRDIKYFFNEKDLQVFEKAYDIIKIIDDVTCECQKIEKQVLIVEGYLYDGKYWYPAHQTWDGWVEYDEYDLMQR